MLVFVAFGIVEEGAAGQAEDADELEQRKAAPGFLGTKLGISALVFEGIRQRESGAVDDFGPQPMPQGLLEGTVGIGLGGDGMAQALEGVQGQAQASLTVGAGAFGDAAQVVKAEEGAHLADDGATRAAGLQDLIKEAPEGAAEAKDALPAVESVVGLGQATGWNQMPKESLQTHEARGATAVAVVAAAQGGEPGAKLRKERRNHAQYIYLTWRDVQSKMRGMKTNASSLAVWERQYERLCQRLAQTGYISQGSVLDRATLGSGRTGYQWTRKVARKTITVALSREQYHSLKQAIQNERKLMKIIGQMERLSRQILFATARDTHRRKPLDNKVLGLI